METFNRPWLRKVIQIESWIWKISNSKEIIEYPKRALKRTLKSNKVGGKKSLKEKKCYNKIQVTGKRAQIKKTA